MTRPAPLLTAHAAQAGETIVTCLTARELYAALALQGLAASGKFPAVPNATVAQWAVGYADALEAALADDREDA